MKLVRYSIPALIILVFVIVLQRYFPLLFDLQNITDEAYRISDVILSIQVLLTTIFALFVAIGVLAQRQVSQIVNDAKQSRDEFVRLWKDIAIKLEQEAMLPALSEALLKPVYNIYALKKKGIVEDYDERIQIEQLLEAERLLPVLNATPVANQISPKMLNKITVLCLSEGNLSRACSYANKAIEIIETKKSNKKEYEYYKKDLAMAYYNKASFYWELAYRSEERQSQSSKIFYHRSLFYSETANKIDPELHSAYATSGWLLDEFEKYEDAINAYNEAILHGSDDPYLYYNIGCAYAKWGKKLKPPQRDELYDKALFYLAMVNEKNLYPIGEYKGKDQAVLDTDWDGIRNSTTHQGQFKKLVGTSLLLNFEHPYFVMWEYEYL
jgi:tetratricopeptide (TPR) repeat protein